MKILVLGGTRFLGRRLVEKLNIAGHAVTVLSRHPERCPAGAYPVGAERQAGLAKLSGKYFDVVFDFIAYDGLAPKQVFDSIGFGNYVLISSTWITRISSGIKADQPLLELDQKRLGLIYEATQRYLTGKMQAETTVLERYNKKKDAVILRLPIIWGEGDHTKRINFYLERIIDGWPLICVEGGANYAQLLWKEDIAACLCSGFSLLTGRPIWEALPHNKIRVKDVIKFIAAGIGRDVELKNISIEQLENRLEEYLRAEPLWQEVPLAITEGNLFKKMRVDLTPYSEWLTKVSKLEKVIEKSSLREKEIDFLKKTNAG